MCNTKSGCKGLAAMMNDLGLKILNGELKAEDYPWLGVGGLNTKNKKGV